MYHWSLKLVIGRLREDIQRRESAATLCRKDRHWMDTMLMAGG